MQLQQYPKAKRIVGLDTETAPFGPARQAPPLVCLSLAFLNGQKVLLAANDPNLIGWVVDLLEDESTLIVGFNAAFDFAVLLQYAAEIGHYKRVSRAIFKAYADNRIVCGFLRQKMADLANGCLRISGTKADLPSQSHLPKKKRSGYYSLAGCLWRAFRLDVGADKTEDAWRTSYYLLQGLPVSGYPADAVRYAVEDAVHHLQLFLWQAREYSAAYFTDEYSQARAHFALELISDYGLRTDAAEVAKLERYCLAVVEPVQAEAIAANLYRVERVKGAPVVRETKKAMQAAVEEACAKLGEPAPRTNPSRSFPAGQIKVDKDTLSRCGTVVPLLGRIAAAMQAKKTLQKDVPLLQRGTVYPIHTYFNSLLETGRTSSSPNVQNPARASLPCVSCGAEDKAGAHTCDNCGAELANVRRCFVPRPGYVYCSTDYDQLELCTLAQAQYDLIGRSTLGEYIKAGADVHCVLAGDLLGISYEEVQRRRSAGDKVVKHRRQVAKGGNFGLPGRMGAKGLLQYWRNFGVFDQTLADARRVIDTYFKRFSDMRSYFAVIDRAFKGRQKGTITLPRTGLTRGDCYITAACNFMFQAQAAAGAKAALFALATEMYVPSASPLYGCRSVNFLHDEALTELPETRAHSAAMRQSQIMREVMQGYTPDVPIRGCEPALMRRWLKSAEPAYNSAGCLIPWDDLH